jgi:hypothetical protein
MHLHEHTFQVVTDGAPGPRKDTVVVPAMRTVTVDHVADNPGTMGAALSQHLPRRGPDDDGAPLHDLRSSLIDTLRGSPLDQSLPVAAARSPKVTRQSHT